MTSYRRIAKIELDSDAVDPHEDFKYVNSELSNHKVMEVVHDGYYLVRDDDDGDVHMIGEVTEELGGDYYASTDEVAKEIDNGYELVSFPHSNRHFVWIDDE